MTPGECWSAVVILRLDGRVVGVGEAHDSEPIEHALSAAIADARQRSSSSKSEPEVASWQRMTLELELGSKPEPLIGADYAQAAQEVEPALDGIAVRRGDQWALAHPCVLQSLNAAASPEQSLLSLVLQLGLPARELAELTPTEKVGLYRFHTTRIVQPALTMTPTLALRGARTQPILSATSACIEANAVADSIVEWFDRSMIRAPSGDATHPAGERAALISLGIRGDYLPADGVDATLCAPPAEQALSAYALARFARLNAAESPLTSKARALAREVINALGEVSEIESDPLTNRKAVAWIVMAAVELGGDFSDAPKARALVAQATETLKTQGIQGDPLEQALAAVALTALDQAGRPAVDRAVLVTSVDKLWQAQSRAQLVGVLGWMLIADGHLGVNDPTHTELARAARVALSRAQLAVEESLDVAAATRTPPDLIGGFALSGIGSKGATAQSARPGHALALMLGDPQVTPVGEQFRARAMQVGLVRFMRQLTYDEVSSYLAPDPRRTMGAIRTAPWDSRVSVAGNAMALLCLKESAVSLARINSLLETAP
ncbi:MAG: hypothetical protein EXS17_06345 [Phycisphaerales bacterium]|nr:hypothetical protein [Phycisphaerales bacterium]